MPSEHIIAMIKFGADEHIHAMHHDGDIYCNPIEYFKRKDLDEARHDDWEGASHIFQPHFLSSFVIGNFDILPDVVGPIKFRNIEPDQLPVTHLFCMVYLSRSHLETRDYIVDSKIKRFGDSYCVILNPKQFLIRFERQVKIMGGSHFKCAPIKYVADEFHGAYGPYKKRRSYKWQQEIRFSFCMPNRLNMPVKVPLSSLEDICVSARAVTFENKILKAGA